jgi:hypothetical protein
MTTHQPNTLAIDGQAALLALDEVAALYRDGAAHAALARLSNLPEVDALRRDDVQRWLERAARRIAAETGGGSMAPAPVAACLRAAANVIARLNAPTHH